MLIHKVLGPRPDGTFAVGYPTPGTTAITVVCDGCTAAAARSEALRLNREQLATERAIRDERQACGLRGVYPALKKGR